MRKIWFRKFRKLEKEAKIVHTKKCINLNLFEMSSSKLITKNYKPIVSCKKIFNFQMSSVVSENNRQRAAWTNWAGSSHKSIKSHKQLFLVLKAISNKNSRYWCMVLVETSQMTVERVSRWPDRLVSLTIFHFIFMTLVSKQIKLFVYVLELRKTKSATGKRIWQACATISWHIVITRHWHW